METKVNRFDKKNKSNIDNSLLNIDNVVLSDEELVEIKGGNTATIKNGVCGKGC